MTDDNREVIDAVISSIHSESHLRALSKYFSADFVIESQNLGILNFDEYANYIGSACTHCELDILSVVEHSDGYEVDTIITMIDNQEKHYSKLPCRSFIYISDGIISRMENRNNPTPVELDYITRHTKEFVHRYS